MADHVTIVMYKRELEILMSCLDKTNSENRLLYSKLQTAFNKLTPMALIKPPLSAARLAEMQAEENKLVAEMVAKQQRQKQCTASDMEEFMKLDREIETIKNVLRNLKAARK